MPELRQALRQIARSPGFSLIVVLTLGLGIGANTAIFSLLDQVLLRRLPVSHPEELVVLDGPGAFSGRTENDQAFSHPMYLDFRDRNQVFSGVIARFPAGVSVAHQGRTELANLELVSGNYLDVLGVAPALGRGLAPSDDVTPGGHPVVMLGHGYWQRRFGGDASLVGQALTVNGRPMTVVGVSPAGFHGIEVGADPDLYVPLAMKASMTPNWDGLGDRKHRWLNVMARLKPGVSLAQAKAGMDVLYKQILAEDIKLYPEASALFRERFLAKKLVFLPGLRGRSDLRRSFSTPLVVLMAMVGLVLLIACANVANLLVAKATTRQRELAIRLALGAGRRHLVRQLLVESLLLALLGGAAGLLFAQWTGGMLLGALPFDQALRAFSSEPDPRVVGFALAVSLLTGVLFGLYPALQVTRPSVVQSLKDEAAAVVGGSSVRFRKALVVAQVALSLLLLVGAGLFARSLYNLRRLDLGFTAQGLLAFMVDPSLNGYDQTRVREAFRRIEQELAALPGVAAVSASREPIVANAEWRSTIKVRGYEPKEGEDMSPTVNAVGAGYFSTLGFRLAAGREFDERDDAGAPPVAVVNETFARYFFGEESALGRRFAFARDESTQLEIVGVVHDAKTVTLREEPTRMFYVPYRQDRALNYLTLYVRTRGDERALADEVRAAVARVEPDLPVFGLKTMNAQLGETLFVERMIAALSLAFGVLATLLAAVGLYGVMSFAVARRTREIGIRMALGAERRRVLGLVLHDVALLAGIGIAIGLPASVALSRLLASQLFGISPWDPLTLALAAAVLALVTLAAGWAPARRATRLDPMVALRYE
jgi:predicted permease